ncbi:MULTISPECIES: ElyC/SanA/YdcF family protein [Streptomyces]
MTVTRPHAIGAPGYSETLPCREESAVRARQLVTTALSAWGLHHLVDPGALIISELVSNAVQHSGRDVMRVIVIRPEDDRVRLAVSDKSRSKPTPQQPGNNRETGRGLLIIEAVAHEWGVDYRRWGKVVWVDLLAELVFTGGRNPTAPEWFPRGEAVHFREHAIALGVPEEAILLEPKARNTGQNITLSREVLAAAGITPETVLLVSMPYMERRAFATARKVWPEVEVICVSEPLEFDDYLKSIGDEKLVTDQLVGDLQRVIEYPKLGFALEQDVPEDVHSAYESLIAAGFDSRLLKP